MNTLPPEPRREDYPDDESFQEARDFWRHRVGHVKKYHDHYRRSKDSRPGSRSPDKDK